MFGSLGPKPETGWAPSSPSPKQNWPRLACLVGWEPSEKVPVKPYCCLAGNEGIRALHIYLYIYIYIYPLGDSIGYLIPPHSLLTSSRRQGRLSASDAGAVRQKNPGEGTNLDCLKFKSLQPKSCMTFSTCLANIKLGLRALGFKRVFVVVVGFPGCALCSVLARLGYFSHVCETAFRRNP